MATLGSSKSQHCPTQHCQKHPRFSREHRSCKEAEESQPFQQPSSEDILDDYAAKQLERPMRRERTSGHVLSHFLVIVGAEIIPEPHRSIARIRKDHLYGCTNPPDGILRGPWRLPAEPQAKETTNPRKTASQENGICAILQRRIRRPERGSLKAILAIDFSFPIPPKRAPHLYVGHALPAWAHVTRLHEGRANKCHARAQPERGKGIFHSPTGTRREGI